LTLLGFFLIFALTIREHRSRAMRVRPFAAAVLGVFLASCGGGNRVQPAAGLGGNVIEHPVQAADFTLTDQHGLPFHMADTRGKVALMSFIYTSCTDICPFEAVKVKVAHDLLGADADKVAFVTVTTDPKRDTPEVMGAYSKTLGMFDAWHFVGGSPKDVKAVWFNYGIGVTVDPETEAVAAKEEASSNDTEKASSEESSGHSHDMGDRGLTSGLSEVDLDLVGKLEQSFGGGYDVGHSAPFWFVDKRGYIRAVMDGGATPEDLVRNIRVLLALK
jgi:cytochrome oxidase Cu insertion factor (SCO1/SenC/PrrC family)